MAFVNQGRQVNTTGVAYFSAFPLGTINGFYMGGTAHNDTHCGGCGSGKNWYFCDIKSVPFSTGNASIVGYLTGGNRTHGVGVSSDIHGYLCGGGGTSSNEIQRFQFTNPSANTSDVGDIAAGLTYVCSGAASGTDGYITNEGNIYKFPFASATTPAPDVGNLANRRGSTGSYSSTHGYQAGGSAPATDTIDRFLFANESTTDDVGDLARTDMNACCGASSADNGYCFGRGQILKYSFSSSSSGPDVGDLPFNVTEAGNGISSSTHGYTVGGGVHETRIHKFSFDNESSQAQVGYIGGSSEACGSSNDSYSGNWNRYAGSTCQY